MNPRLSYVGKVYTYDGLYEVIFVVLDVCFLMYVSRLSNILVVQVVNYRAETGISGFTVYKFRLERLDVEGQPTLTTAQVYSFHMCYKTVYSFNRIACKQIL